MTSLRELWQPWMLYHYGIKPTEVGEYTEAELKAMVDFIQPTQTRDVVMGESPTAYLARTRG